MRCRFLNFYRATLPSGFFAPVFRSTGKAFPVLRIRLKIALAPLLVSVLFLFAGCGPKVITQSPVSVIKEYRRVAAPPIEVVIEDESKKNESLLDSMERLIRDNLIDLLDDRNADTPDELRDHLTERVNYNLLNLGFVPIERTRLQSILKEAGFQQSGATDAKTAARIGELSNAESLFFGRLFVQMGRKNGQPKIDITFTGRLVSVREGTILLSGTMTETDREASMEDLVEIIDEWFDHVEPLED